MKLALAVFGLAVLVTAFALLMGAMLARASGELGGRRD